MRAINRHFCSRSRSISVMNLLARIWATTCMFASWISFCSAVGSTRTISSVRSGNCLATSDACTPQQNWPHLFAEFIQTLVSERLATFIHHMMPVKELIGGPEQFIVHKTRHGEQFAEPVFQRRARKHQPKRTVQLRMMLLVFDSQFLIRWPSSKMIKSQGTDSIADKSRNTCS